LVAVIVFIAAFAFFEVAKLMLKRKPFVEHKPAPIKM
jgi:hypothetical protein